MRVQSREVGRFVVRPSILLFQPEPESHDSALTKLPREKGLDTQNYKCRDCGQLIGLTFAKAMVCGFSGEYFCPDCMAVEEFAIPSRIVYNWDFGRHAVSQRAAKYLIDCPVLLDLKALNPRIYNAVDAMARLRTLRIQLNFLRAYLFTCREPTIEALQGKVSPRTYLYDHIHR